MYKTKELNLADYLPIVGWSCRRDSCLSQGQQTEVKRKQFPLGFGLGKPNLFSVTVTITQSTTPFFSCVNISNNDDIIMES